MSFAVFARSSGIRAAPSRVMELGGPFQLQGRVCSRLQLRAGSVSRLKRFLRKGGTPEMTHEARRFVSNGGTPEMTHKDCVKLMKELNSRGQHLEQRMKFLDNMNIMMIGLTGGALVAVAGQHYSNINESVQRAEELAKAQEDLRTGQDILAKAVATMAELKDLYAQREGPTAAGPVPRSSR